MHDSCLDTAAHLAPHHTVHAVADELKCCMQDDLLYETLTVHETLFYAAMLRLPSAMSTEQKTERVEHVIQTLGLDKCKDTIVGAPATFLLSLWGYKGASAPRPLHLGSMLC